jgi:hypothetical protein
MTKLRWPWDALKLPNDEVFLTFPDHKDPLVWMESVTSLARLYAKRHGFRVRTNKVREGIRVIRAA